MNETFAQIWALVGLVLFFIGIGVVKARKAGPFLLFMLVILGYAAVTVVIATGGK